MDPQLQTPIALLIVAAAAVGLLIAAWRRRGHHGSSCGGCGPRTDKFKQSLKR